MQPSKFLHRLIAVWATLLLSLTLCPRAEALDAVPTAQLGHSGYVVAVAFSPDGRLVLSGSYDHSLKLWEAATGRLVRTFEGHQDEVWSVAFSPDGRLLLSGSYDNTLKLWEAATGRLVRTFEGHQGEANSIAFSPDGQFVLAADGDKTIKQWEIATARLVRTFEGKAPFALSPDGQLLLSALEIPNTLERTLTLQERETGRLLHTFEPRQYTSVAFSPDGQLVLTASGGNTLKLWESATGRLVRTFEGHRDIVNSVAFSPDGKFVLSGSRDATLKLWESATGRLVHTFEGHRASVWSVAFSPEGKFVLSGSWDNTLKMWESATGKLVRTFEGHQDIVHSVAFSPDGRSLLSGGGDKIVRLWESATGRLVRTYAGHHNAIWSVAFSPDGQSVLSGSQTPSSFQKPEDDTLKLWETATGRLLRSFDDHLSETVYSAVFSPDGQFVLSAGGGDKTVKLWESASGRLVRRLQDHRYAVTSGSFSPDGKWLLSGSHDNTLKLWEFATGLPIRSFEGHQYAVTSVAFSPDGRRVLSGSIDRTVKLWESATGRLLRTFEGHGEQVNSVAFSPNGRSVLSGSSDRTLKLWDSATGRLVHTFEGHQDLVRSVAFSPGGRQIISGSNDGTIKIWNSGDGSLLATLINGADDEWIAVTPEGFFDASLKGAELLHVVRGLEVTGIDQVYQSLFRPDLVREKLAGDPKGKVKEAAAKLDLDKVLASGGAPRVRILGSANRAPATDEKIKIEADIDDTGGGVGRIEWRVNGLTVGLEERGGGALIEKDSDNAPGDKTKRISREIWLEPGNNEVEVVAYNIRNLIASNPVRTTIRWEGAGVRNAPRLYVLAIGIDDYWDGRLHLAFADADAKALSAAFGEAGKGLYESVTVLPPVLDKSVTKDQLETVFNDLTGKVRPRDVFVFFLAGHGKTIDGRYYFIPYDFRYENERSIEERGISQEQWQAWFAKIPARKSVLIYDTCESGSLTADKVAARSLDNVIEQGAAFERLVRATGRTILAATTDDAPAREGYRGHGVFTYAVLEALAHADVNRDGFIEVTSLISYVDQEVPEISQQAFHFRQIPQTKFTGSNFPLAKPVSNLAAAAETAIPTKPSHVVVRSMEIYTKPSDASEIVRKIEPGTSVAVIRTEQGWVLIAKDGKALGYVAKSGIAPLQ
jgi:WD40 repeat protein/uncharacterized caspase-like protein